MEEQVILTEKGNVKSTCMCVIADYCKHIKCFPNKSEVPDFTIYFQNY